MVNENIKLLCFGLELSQPNDLILARKAVKELQMALVIKNMQIDRLFLTSFDKLTLSKCGVHGQEGKLIKRVSVVMKLGTPDWFG